MEVLPQSKRNQNSKSLALKIEWNQTNAIDLNGGKNCDRFEQSGAFNPFRNVFSQPWFFVYFWNIFFCETNPWNVEHCMLAMTSEKLSNHTKCRKWAMACWSESYFDDSRINCGASTASAKRSTRQCKERRICSNHWAARGVQSNCFEVITFDNLSRARHMCNLAHTHVVGIHIKSGVPPLITTMAMYSIFVVCKRNMLQLNIKIRLARVLVLAVCPCRRSFISWFTNSKWSKARYRFSCRPVDWPTPADIPKCVNNHLILIIKKRKKWNNLFLNFLSRAIPSLE